MFLLADGNHQVQHSGLNDNFLSMNEMNAGAAEEFLDVDIDRSEFDKYLSGGYVTNNQLTSVNMATAPSCSFYGSGDLSTATGSTFEQHDSKDNVVVHDYPLMKSEPVYDHIQAPGSSLSSALADVRSVYYDC